MYQNQAQDKTNNNFAIIDDFTLIIDLGDFNQFLLINLRFLLACLITNNEKHDKNIQSQFTLVLLFIK